MIADKLPTTVPVGRIAELGLAEHPKAERIGTRLATADIFSDYIVKVFSSREVLARCIRMQERGPSEGKRLWRAVVKLSDGEGY